MQKNILLFIFIGALFSGLSGCSCSQKPIVEAELPAGLYIANVTVNEEDDGQTDVSVTIKLQRDNTETVTVKYDVIASTNDTKALAIIGDVASDANTPILDVVDVLAKSETVVFDETSTDELTISITIVNDTTYEEDEVFLVRLSAATGANIVAGEGVAEVTLKNNDSLPLATISMLDESVGASDLTEENPAAVNLKVSLDAVSAVPATLEVFRSSALNVINPGFTAAYRVDYMLYQNSEKLPANAEIIILPGETEAFFDVQVINDGIKENKETFEIGLSARKHVSISSEIAQKFTITDDDTRSSVAVSKLNDTGVVELPAVSLSGTTEGFADKNLGRDSTVVSASKIGGGRAGFDFSKIDSDGDGIWECVKDNVTGLIWEVKLKGESSERGAGRVFYWYDPNYATNGGEPGTSGRFQCKINDSLAGDSCSTAYYVADMNEQKLCGMTGWRMPTIDELRSIVDYGVSNQIHYDTEYFNGDLIGSAYVWSSTTNANNPTLAWAIRFGATSFLEVPQPKKSFGSKGIRLVNETQIQAQ